MKVLDINGLTRYDTKIKNYINNYIPTGVKNAYNVSQTVKMAVCTQAQYDALNSYDSNTVYVISDSEVNTYYHHFVTLTTKSGAGFRVSLHMWLPTATVYTKASTFFEYVAGLTSYFGGSLKPFYYTLVRKTIITGWTGYENPTTTGNRLITSPFAIQWEEGTDGDDNEYDYVNLSFKVLDKNQTYTYYTGSLSIEDNSINTNYNFTDEIIYD